MSVSNSTHAVKLPTSDVTPTSSKGRPAGEALRIWRYQLLLLVALIAILYAPVLKDLVSDWWNDPDYTHGFLVPIVVAGVLLTHGKRYSTVRVKPSIWGLGLMILALSMLVAGSLAADYFTSRISLCVVLAG